MDKDTLRKVQMVQLEIAKEIKRVCEKNQIKFFLTAGTLLGAVRHGGFIPWDDDLDIAMLKEDYDSFIKIAPRELKPQYELQEWNSDSNYPNEFAKVRKKGTLYVENKSRQDKDVGIYVDVFSYFNFPNSIEEQRKVHKQMLDLHRLLLMKCKYRPWAEDNGINWKKRIGYVYYQVRSLFIPRGVLVEKFESIRNKYSNSTGILHDMIESEDFRPLKREWFQNVIPMKFEDDDFPVPEKYEGYLSTWYGDYMQLPPLEERENRHQIVRLDLGK